MAVSQATTQSLGEIPALNVNTPMNLGLSALAGMAKGISAKRTSESSSRGNLLQAIAQQGGIGLPMPGQKADFDIGGQGFSNLALLTAAKTRSEIMKNLKTAQGGAIDLEQQLPLFRAFAIAQQQYPDARAKIGAGGFESFSLGEPTGSEIFNRNLATTAPQFQQQPPPTLEGLAEMREQLRENSIHSKAQVLQAGATGKAPVQSQAQTAGRVPNIKKKYDPDNPQIGQELQRGGVTYFVNAVVDGKPTFLPRR